MLERKFILKDIPLFSGLSTGEYSFIAERSEIREYRKGEVIYKEGAPADAFYCIISGRVMVYTQDAQGNELTLEHLHRGKYFGIISILTGSPHSVTARAVNDSLALAIKKEDFEAVLKKIPSLAIDLSRTLSRRLKDKGLRRKTVFESTVIAVYSSYSQSGKTVYALNLGLGLKKETGKSAIVLDICFKDKSHSLPAKLEMPEAEDSAIGLAEFSGGSQEVKERVMKNKFGLDLLCLIYTPGDDSCVKRLLNILSALVNDYHYIILDLPSEMDRGIFGMLNQADNIHLLTSPEPVDLKRTRSLMERLKDEFGFQESKISVVINEYKLAKLSHDEQAQLLGRGIYATLPKIELEGFDRPVFDSPDCEYSRAVRRISRQIGECLVGLVFGVGFAYGFCHIGVLKVLEEEKIPVDVIAGASVGSFIASLWACGKTSEEIIQAVSAFKEPKHLWEYMDFTFPLLGFLKGNKLHNLIRKQLGKKTFYDVKLPLRIIASNVKMKEPKILDKGLLADAVMASCSMPGLFRPFRLQEEMLFDGGVIYPLPTEVLLKMGVKKIIAVNVTPSREDILKQYEKMKEDFSAGAILKKRGAGLKAFLKEKFETNILGIIFSSIEVMQSEMVQKEAQLADVVLHPDTRGLHWLELYRVREFAKRGEDEARKNLEKIKQLISE